MLRRRTPRRRASITSLIDVIFLLLLFFMLASSFTRFSEVEVMAATGGKSGSAQGNKGVKIYIEPQTVLIGGKKVQENEIAKSLNDQKTGETLVVTINVSQQVSTQRLVDILSKLNQVPDISVHLVEAT
jgi:biopolymer transport protein ExbD